MKLGNIVKIKENAIQKGLLKERCKKLLGMDGIVLKDGVANTKDEVSIYFYNDMMSWIMPKESLIIIREKKYMSLTELQTKRAKALYLHLMNHIEVQGSLNSGIPMCKICNKSAHQIYTEDGEPIVKG